MSPESFSMVLLRWTILAAFVVTQAASVPSRSKMADCNSFNCDLRCNEDNPSYYEPQKCDDCCHHMGDGGSGGSSATFGDRLKAMESAVTELRVMTGVLLFLVLLLVLAVALLLLKVGRDTPGKFLLHSFFRCKKNGEKEKNQKHCNGVSNTTTVSRLADHQSNSSPYSRRASVPVTTPVNADLEPHPFPFRKRQPSESTCPEEGSDVTPQGYDNLALSTSTINTSTLHNTSTDTLSPALSTNTMQTTLHSENQLHSAVHNNTNV